MIYGQGKIAESQGKVREFLFPDPVGTLNYIWTIYLVNFDQKKTWVKLNINQHSSGILKEVTCI